VFNAFDTDLRGGTTSRAGPICVDRLIPANLLNEGYSRSTRSHFTRYGKLLPHTGEWQAVSSRARHRRSDSARGTTGQPRGTVDRCSVDHGGTLTQIVGVILVGTMTCS
jgi:hypothetical protein